MQYNGGQWWCSKCYGKLAWYGLDAQSSAPPPVREWAVPIEGKSGLGCEGKLPPPQVTYLSDAERDTSAATRRSSKDPTAPVPTRVGYLGSVPISMSAAAAVPNAISMLLSKLETLHKRAG